ncbi:MAG TPA: winged helix-turn-helix transcriptional regulator [Solirubrobacterales bacterium]
MPAKQKAQPRLIDDRLVTALSHETRAHALAVFTERPASTKEIAGELKKSVSAVWYHVDKLVKLGCIELVRSEKRRGAMEHFYRATVRHFFSDDAWENVPKPERLAISMGVLRLIAGDVDEAMQTETVDAIDRHLTRTQLILDKEGWQETSDLLAETLEGLLGIREKSAMRRAESNEKAIRASVSIMQFELPSRAGS